MRIPCPSPFLRWTLGVVLAICSPIIPAALAADGSPFTLLGRVPDAQLNAEPWIRAGHYQAFNVDAPALRDILAAAPLEFTPRAQAEPLIFTIPAPDGTFQRFRVVESPVMEPGLAAQFPEIKTFLGQGVDDPYASARFDITPQGFHAQVLTADGAGSWYIDPFTRGNSVLHSSYFRRDLKGDPGWACHTPAPLVIPRDLPDPPMLSSGGTLRTYRLCVACTGEYAAFHGGTVALAQAAIVTAVNRVTGVYEKEVDIRLTLIATNSSVVYTNSGTDPFTNSDGATMLSQNQSTLTSVIGSANYDIGHAFATGEGGIASLGSVCVSNRKAQGVTGRPSPTGDPFWIDYVAHEMGHQFGGNHTFNSTTSSCGGGNRNAGTAYETGSGSTIMAYAGICGSDDLQANSDAYFHTASYDEIRAYVTSGSGANCGTAANTGNNAPSVNGGADYTIPISTPFALTASGSDPDGDALTFCWEERALGASTTVSAADNGVSPIDRSRSPLTSPVRTVPALTNLLNNTVATGEKLPTANRVSWPWRVTARDNKAGGGGVNQDDIVLAVTTTSGPFTVTFPNTNVSIGGAQTVTWNVANTTASPVSCANVKISLSTDGGNTFPTVLASSTPNDGSESVVLPNISSSTARVKVEAVGNIFFDISNVNFTVVPVSTGVNFQLPGPNVVSDTTGNGNNNGIPEPGETSVALTLPLRNTGGDTATGVSATLVSLTPTVTVTTAVSAYPNIALNNTVNNTTPFVINVNASHPCGAPINLKLNVTSTQGAGAPTFSINGGTPGSSVTATFSYTGPAASIPDGSSPGVTVNLPVSGTGTIQDINFRFDGSSCSTTIGSTTVGLDHSYVGDLIVTLTSPQGTPVILMNRPGSASGTTSGSNGNNFCQTILDDDGAFTAIQSIATGGTGAPYSGSYLPNSPLSAFDGQNADGIWQLNVRDAGVNDTGSVRAFSLIITYTSSAVCAPPASVTGACCVGGGVCLVLSPTACTEASGTYQSNGAPCNPNPCPQPTGGCCVNGGLCFTYTQSTCTSLGYTYMGNGAVCNPNPCPQPTGACCLSTGTCTAATVIACDVLGGFHLGVGELCLPNPCPQPSGACCVVPGSCAVIPHSECSAGYQGDDTTCAPDPCPVPTGGCCAGGGVCEIKTQAQCAAGYQGNGTTCMPNPCPQPTGACCAADGSCTVSDDASCATAWISGDTCVPNICQQPTGSCCTGAGGCTVTEMSGCAATWTQGGSCTPNICPQPQGACCAQDGFCTNSTQAGCAASWIPGAACGPNPCPQPQGACCAASGDCTVTDSAGCAANWTSGGTCTPNPCPQPQGSCCAASGECTVTDAAGCSATWTQGAGCTPNTCPQPQGSCCAADGGCTVTDAAGCSATWTQGAGCTPNLCPQPTGACCVGTACSVSTGAACGGTFSGPGSACGAPGNPTTCCPANFNGSGGVSVQDIFDFLNAWFASNMSADFNTSGAVSVQDIFDFLSAWFAGC